MIGFILSLLGLAALTLLTFAFGAAIGMYIAVEALTNDNKEEMKVMCDDIQCYWNDKKRNN